MLKIEQFVEQQFGIKLTKHQLEIIAIIAANPDERVAIQIGGRSAGKTTAFKAAFAYLQDGLKPVESEKVDRFEVIDDTGRAYVKGSIYGSPIKVDLSYQDDGKTLKAFVGKRK